MVPGIYSVSALDALTHFVSQEHSTEGYQNDIVITDNNEYQIKLHFGAKPTADKTNRLEILTKLIQNWNPGIRHDSAVYAAFITLKAKLIEEQSQLQKNCIQIFIEKLFGTHQQNSADRKTLHAKIDGIIRQLTSVIQENHLPRVDSQHHARIKFESEFRQIFGESPVAMCGGEIVLYDLYCKRVWNSTEVQGSANKYAEFRRRITEFHIGTHWIDQTPAGGRSLLEEVIDVVDIFDRVYGRVETRVSSHYGPVGREIHHHIRGYRFRETLLHDGSFRYHNATILGGRYALNAEVTHEATWGQTENTSDGPDRWSYSVHRGWDFPRYFFLRKVFKIERCQISQYYAVGIGRGKGDARPEITHHT